MYYFKFADIGEGIHEGVIYKWLVSEGDTVKDGQTLFTVETDKVTAEIPSPVDGAIDKINFQEGDTIQVGDVAVVINDGSGQESLVSKENSKDKNQAEVTTYTEQVKEKGSTSVVGEIEVSSELIAASNEAEQDIFDKPMRKKVLATPVARKMAKDLEIDINTLQGTGPAGRVMKADIQVAYDNRSTQSQCAQQSTESANVNSSKGQVTHLKMTQMRKTIANNMVKSKFTIPHTAAMDEVDVSKLVSYRQKLNKKLERQGIKLTYMPFIIKAVSRALKMHPIVNASLDEATDTILLKHDINIGMATDTEEGLTVPVLKNADRNSLLELAEKIRQKAELARDKQLTLADFSDGTFSITNYGSVGTKFGVPVIKYPEAAILGIGTIYKKAAVDIEGNIVVQDTLPLSMSFDHRIIDGADAGRFINTLKSLLSDPDMLMMN